MWQGYVQELFRNVDSETLGGHISSEESRMHRMLVKSEFQIKNEQVFSITFLPAVFRDL